MYLLDTNVISELRKLGDGRCDPNVERWIAGPADDELHLSVMSIMEIELGILRLERRDRKQAGMLRTWMQDHVEPAFADGILPMTIDIASRCARLHVPDPRSERDAWIAATALVHDLIVVTRNVADFAETGVSLLNPWDDQSA